MNAGCFLRRLALVALLTALPSFSAVSAGGSSGQSGGAGSSGAGGGSGSSGGGGGGHPSGGGGGGSSGGKGGHGVGVSSVGGGSHSGVGRSGVSGSGHSLSSGRGSAGNGGHAIVGGGQAIGGKAQANGSRNNSASTARPSTVLRPNANNVQRGTVQINKNHSFGNNSSGDSDAKRRGGNLNHEPGTAWNKGDPNCKEGHHQHNNVVVASVPYSTGGYSFDYYDDYYSKNNYYPVPSVSASIQLLVQTALARRGYYAGQVDGVIGPETRNAIREFQRDNGLEITGDINSRLVQALKLG